MNNQLDMLFVHPPAQLGGGSHTLDADVGYTGQFVAMPMGFFNMADRLDQAGYQVRILNLGERLYLSKKPFQELVKNLLIEYQPQVVGLDLHWMIHSAGTVETARTIKELSPETIVIVGGISASYFYEDLLNSYPAVDYVMVGECDNAIVHFLNEITKPQPTLERVPNLAYRTNQGVLLNHCDVPDISCQIDLTRHDLLVDPPMINADRALISFFRGCINSCDFCAGSKSSFHHVMRRPKTGIVSPETLVALMVKNLEKGRDKIYLYGDVRLCGQDYVDRFFEALGNAELSGAHVVFEFFDQLATAEYLEKWASWAQWKGATLECTHSPDEGNQKIRQRYGKGYTNEQLFEHCRLVADYGIPQSIYFLLGLPGQTEKTVQESLEVAETVVDIYARRFTKHNLRHEVASFNLMQIPDAGSNIFRSPERYGFHLHFQGIQELVGILSQARHWSEAVSYHTDELSRQDLIRLFYHIQTSLLQIYQRHGLISEQNLVEGLQKYELDARRVSVVDAG